MAAVAVPMEDENPNEAAMIFDKQNPAAFPFNSTFDYCNIVVVDSRAGKANYFLHMFPRASEGIE